MDPHPGLLPIAVFNWGGRDGVLARMHKRTTPRIFGRAKALHRNMTPAEAKLWQHLRAHRMGDVHFGNQHAIGNYIVLTGSQCSADPL